MFIDTNVTLIIQFGGEFFLGGDIRDGNKLEILGFIGNESQFFWGEIKIDFKKLPNRINDKCEKPKYMSQLKWVFAEMCFG